MFFRDLKAYFREFLAVENRSTTVTLILVTAAGVLLRLNFLWHTLRYDEQMTVIVSSQPLTDILTRYEIPNNHVFHSFLLNISRSLFGDGLGPMRLPALIAGILMIPAAYVAASIIYDRYAGVLAAAMVSASSVLVEYSVLARGYSLVILFFLATLALAAYVLKTNNSFAWVLIAVLAALGFYTIPIMLYPFGIVATWLLLSTAVGGPGIRRAAVLGKLAWSTALAGLLTALLYAPILLNSTYRSALSIPELETLGLSELSGELLHTARVTWVLWTRDAPIVVIVLLVTGFCASLVFYRKTTDFRVPLVAAVAAWLLPVLLIQRVAPFDRVWLFLLPLFFMLASAGTGSILRLFRDTTRARAVLFPAAAIVLFALMSAGVLAGGGIEESQQGGSCRQAEEVTDFLEGYLEPGDRVLSYCPCDLVLGYYLDVKGVPREHTDQNPHQGERLIVVVNTNPVYSQSAATVLEYGNFEYESLRDRLEPVKKFEDVAIYEIRLR